MYIYRTYTAFRARLCVRVCMCVGVCMFMCDLCFIYLNTDFYAFAQSDVYNIKNNNTQGVT